MKSKHMKTVAIIVCVAVAAGILIYTGSRSSAATNTFSKSCVLDMKIESMLKQIHAIRIGSQTYTINYRESRMITDNCKTLIYTIRINGRLMSLLMINIINYNSIEPTRPVVFMCSAPYYTYNLKETTTAFNAMGIGYSERDQLTMISSSVSVRSTTITKQLFEDQISRLIAATVLFALDSESRTEFYLLPR